MNLPYEETDPVAITSRILECVLRTVPYPHLIKDIDLSQECGVLRFTWRGARYRIDGHLRAEEIQGGCLVGSDLAILMSRSLQIASFTDGVLPP